MDEFDQLEDYLIWAVMRDSSLSAERIRSILRTYAAKAEALGVTKENQ